MVIRSAVPKIFNNPAWYKTLTLTERVALLRAQASEQSGDTTWNAERAERKFQSWKSQYPFDKEASFAERLALDSLSEDDLLHLLGESNEAGYRQMHDTPDWLHELAQAFEPAMFPETPGSLASFEVANEVLKEVRSQYANSFLVSIAPLIATGIERLKAGLATLPATYTVLPFDLEATQSVLLVNLARQLHQQINRVLMLELNIARVENRLAGETPEERFRDFVQQLSRKETILALLAEYAPLARILMVTIENWLSYSLEFLQHLCADWDEICQAFCSGSDPGLLVEVTSGIGDLHKQGRSTLKLRFASGFQLMYKPRSLASDEHFQQLFAWLNERGDHLAFLIIQVIDKGTYGWSEYVLSEDCTSTEQVARFYERQGGYLALFYALEATDMHHENLIASGEHPVMTDLEALFHPHLIDLLPPSASTMAGEAMKASVLRVGLLPLRMWGNQERAGVDLSGLGGKGGQLTPHRVLQVEAQGTDHMRYTRQYAQMAEQRNRPTLRGKDVEVLDYSSQLMQGFSRIYRLLMTHRDALLAGPLQAFAHDSIRVVIRPTRTYSQLLFDSYHPDLLYDMLERDRFFDRLWGGTVQQPHLKRLITAEQADLHTGDIPIFTTRPDTRDIYSSRGACIPDFLAEPSQELVKKCVQQLSEEDLARQTWFIQASLATMLIESGPTSYPPSRLQPTQTTASRERLIQAACAVGDRLCERALLGERGANWMGLTFIYDREWILNPAGIDLYSGVAGIALFLAYLGAVTNVLKYQTFAQAALASVREQVKELYDHLLAVGAHNGWGGIIYLYTHLGVLWQDQELLRAAEEQIRLLPDLFDKTQESDVISGYAGCILCLLSLYHVRPSAHTLAVAIQCGDHLLSKAAQCSADPPTATETGDQTISTDRPLAGFSHGAAGMAFSLLKLAAVSGQERFHQGARAALDFERGVFSPEQQNWPDLRDPQKRGMARASLSVGDETHFMATWCHGAPGIGLGRLASLPYFDDGLIREEIAVALQTTLTQGFGLNHALCHGDLGNLETLLTAARTLGDSEYQAHTERLAAMILDSIEAYGWLTSTPQGVETPGLMTGIAGIGYELLRLAAPESVPCLLTLEEPGDVLLKR